jgi:hypothetical protein
MMPIAPKEPALSTNPDYSRAIYYDPPSHDFCSWLMMAEMNRRYHNAPEPLRVKFCTINGQLGTVQFGPLSPWLGKVYPCGVSRAYSDQMIENVLIPAMAMIGAVEEPAIDAPWPLDELKRGRYVEYDHHVSLLVDASRAGHAMPQWQIPQWAQDEARCIIRRSARPYARKPRAVIITLREVHAQPERNSRIEEWLKFAESIGDRYPVLFLRDTCKANEPLPSFMTCPRASTNVYVRAALYQSAFCNLMVGNGPIEWCMFSGAPYLCFKQLCPALPNWQGGQPEGWREQCHLEVGEQWPWAASNQRLTWMDDTFENISQAFGEFVALSTKADANGHHRRSGDYLEQAPGFHGSGPSGPAP